MDCNKFSEMALERETFALIINFYIRGCEKEINERTIKLNR